MKADLLAEQQSSILDAVFCDSYEIWGLGNDDILDVTQSHPSIEFLSDQSRVNSIREHSQYLLPNDNDDILNRMNFLDLHLELKVS
jgi:hypothetical protein